MSLFDDVLSSRSQAVAESIPPLTEVVRDAVSKAVIDGFLPILGPAATGASSDIKLRSFHIKVSEVIQTISERIIDLESSHSDIRERISVIRELISSSVTKLIKENETLLIEHLQATGQLEKPDRVLTKKQATTAIATLKQHPGRSVSIFLSSPTLESRQLAQQLHPMFSAAGWSCSSRGETAESMYVDGRIQMPTGILARFNETSDDLKLLIHTMFTQLELDYRDGGREGSQMFAQQHRGRQVASPDVNITVYPKQR